MSSLDVLPAKTLKGLLVIERALAVKTKAARRRELSKEEFQDFLRQASLAGPAADTAADAGEVTWGQLLAHLSILLLGNANPWKRVFPCMGRGGR